MVPDLQRLNLTEAVADVCSLASHAGVERGELHQLTLALREAVRPRYEA